MCCADESRIDFFTRYRANSADLTLLNVTKQACLSCQGQLANFVQEQRAAVGGFDQPASVAGCACESAFFIAEEFRFDQGIGMAAQFTVTIGRSARRPRRCTSRAASSFPVPVSPAISTVESVCATRSTSCCSAVMAGQLVLR